MKHLDKCKQFKAWKLEEENKGRATRKKRLAESINDFFTPKNASDIELFALAVFTSTANFSMFETPEWTNFFNKVNFKPPRRTHLSTTLLENAYNKTKEQVLEVVSKADHIQIVADGSANIAKTRVENISFLVNGTSFY